MSDAKPLRGAAGLVQRIKNRDDTISALREVERALRARIADLEARKRERRFQVRVDAFYWYGLTHDEATWKLKNLLDLGVGKYARIVEDP